MVLILDGNSDFVARAWRKIDIFGEKSDLHDYSQSNRALNRSNNRDFSLYVRTYFTVKPSNLSTMDVGTLNKKNSLLTTFIRK